MTYYVMANNNIVEFETEEAAKLFAYTMLNDDAVTYLEYGLTRYDSEWPGRSTLVVLKAEVNNEFTSNE